MVLALAFWLGVAVAMGVGWWWRRRAPAKPDRPAAVRRRRPSRTAARLLLLGHAGGFTVPVGVMDQPLLNLSSSLNVGRLTRESGRDGDDPGRGGHRAGTGEVGVGMVTV